MFRCGPERCTSGHSLLPSRVPYSGSAIRDCGAISEPQNGPGCAGRRCPLASCRLDIATAALTAIQRGVRDEHSESGPGPGSIPRTARSNPADGVAIAAFQGPSPAARESGSAVPPAPSPFRSLSVCVGLYPFGQSRLVLASRRTYEAPLAPPQTDKHLSWSNASGSELARRLRLYAATGESK